MSAPAPREPATDPLTDKAAAEAFTAAYRHKPLRSRGEAPPLAVCTWPGSEGIPRCQGSVLEEGSNYSRRYQCERAGKTRLADGTTWCGVHAPMAVARRGAKAAERERLRQARWAAERDAGRLKAERDAAFPRFLEALRQIEAGHNDPRTLARQALGDYLSGDPK